MTSNNLQDNQQLQLELLSMLAEDVRVRAELVSEGSLFAGYHPRMQAVHERNATRLLEILDVHGWPGHSLVGAQAAEAAWLVLQHAIGNPALQRRGLALLIDAASKGEVPNTRIAMLEDRIRCSEGKPQRYGTQFDWDAQGLLSPQPLEDPARVDTLRQTMGLSPLAQDIQRMRAQAAREGEQAPRDWHARQREKEEWLHATGWRK